MLKALEDRSILKPEVQFFLYGSVKFSSIIRIRKKYPLLTNKQCGMIVDFIRSHLQYMFADAFS